MTLRLKRGLTYFNRLYQKIFLKHIYILIAVGNEIRNKTGLNRVNKSQFQNVYN